MSWSKSIVGWSPGVVSSGGALAFPTFILIPLPSNAVLPSGNDSCLLSEKQGEAVWFYG